MAAEYLSNKFIDAVIMDLMFLAVCFILPPFFIIKFIYKIVRCRSTENNMTGKVVLITGASSGIGEHLAYEYAKKGASLAIVARRESRLRQVQEKARGLGSPDVLLVCGDVSNINDCKRFVDETINHYGRLDHLVNNAGIACFHSVGIDVTRFAPVMDINFWGAIYPTFFAIPHLKKSKGKIVVNASGAAFLHAPKTGFYCASKAAVLSFYETLRVELAPAIKITIVTLGYVESEMAQGKHLANEGVVELNTRVREVVMNLCPVMSTKPCAKAIVEGACRGEGYITEPQFFRVLYLIRFICPELMDWYYREFYLAKIDISAGDVPSNPGSIPASHTKAI